MKLTEMMMAINFPDRMKQATDEAIDDPQVGDHFSEMYNFRVFVVHRVGEQVVTISRFLMRGRRGPITAWKRSENGSNITRSRLAGIGCDWWSGGTICRVGIHLKTRR